MDNLVLQFCPASFGLDLAFRKHLNVEEVQGVTRFIFRGDMSVASKVSSITKIPLEQEINSAVSDTDCVSLRIGPDEWLLLMRDFSSRQILSEVKNAAGERSHSLVDVSHRNVGLKFSGEGVAIGLAAGCPLPLGIKRFPIGRCTRTLFGKAEVILWRQAEHIFRMEVWRSFAPYILAFIESQTESSD